MEFRNPANGYTEAFSVPWLWTLLFGPIYFAVKRVSPHVFASIFLALLTVGVSWLIYPFFAQRVMRRVYLRKGWVQVKDGLPIKECMHCGGKNRVDDFT